MMVAIIIVFAGVALYQVRKLKRENRVRDLVFFSVFWLAGFVLAAMLSAGVRLPRTVHTFIALFDWLGLHY